MRKNWADERWPGELPPSPRPEGLLRRALERQNRALRGTIAVVDRLTEMALEGRGIESISEELARAIGARLLVFDELFRPLVAAGEGEDPLGGAEGDARLRAVVDSVRHQRLPLRLHALPEWPVVEHCAIAPVSSGERVLGFLVAACPRGAAGEDLALMTLQHATPIYALAFLREARDLELRRRYRSEFLESLLAGPADPSRAAELARLAGLVPGASYVALAVGPLDGGRDEPLLGRLALELGALGSGFAAVERADHVLVLAPVDDAGDPPARRVAGALGRAFRGLELSLGASRPARLAEGLGGADAEAQRALFVARRLRLVGEVAAHDSLGVHRLLVHVPDEELGRFAADVLGPLVPPAGEHEVLLDTLRSYLAHNGSRRASADELLVHLNTVGYRLGRIEALTGLSLATAGDRVLAQLALEALRILP
ncbi:MAG TPA: helix-turn-helix domain-containing protein [Acidimicrobiales bacterium]|nr:helix-turn-helix domain-containing protein [Acidimicrobiales bacterium]